MKKILLFLLLLPFVSLGQVANGTETKQNAFRSLNPQTVTSVNYLTTMGADGTMGRVSPNNLSFAQADTGVLTFAGMTTNTATTINIGAVNGQIIDNETNPLVPVRASVTYAGATGVTVTTVGSGTASYIMLSSTGVISFQNTFPTSAERKAKIWLGKVSHPAGAVTVVVNEPDYVTSPLAFSRDFFQDLGPYVNNGVFPYANGANLNINTTGGTITGDGINFVTSRTNPNRLDVTPSTVANFAIRTQTGGATAAVNAITPGVYDNAGVITAIGGGAGASTIQHVEYIPGQGYIVQLGQQVYATFNDAVAAVGKETPSFIRWSNLVNNAIPIGVIVVNKTATALNNPAQALFFKADKTGDFFGAQAGVATGTLQTSYLNSVVPQIVTTAGLGAVTIRRGSAADTDNILVGQNGAGTNTSSLSGAGVFTGLSNNSLGSISASGGIARGNYFNNTLVATANNDVLVGLDINPTFNNGAFTGVINAGIRFRDVSIYTQRISSGINYPVITWNEATNSMYFGASSVNTRVYGFAIDFVNSSNIPQARLYSTTGNLTLQNGGAFTDNGVDRLQVTGSVLATGYKVTGAGGTEALLANGGLLTNPVSGAGVTGRVSFWGGTNNLTNDSNLFWDDANKRLGIGTSSPTAQIEATGNIKANAIDTNTTKITITTSTSITTATTDANGIRQDGRHVVIDNGVNVINLTCNGGVTTSYGKIGTGAITFVQGSGRTLVQLSGTAVFNGVAGSTATLWSNGTTDYLSINNY